MLLLLFAKKGVQLGKQEDLYNTNKKIYNELLREYGTRRKVTTRNEMIDSIVKNIQNCESNPKRERNTSED